jgi:hypothetical protein
MRYLIAMVVAAAIGYVVLSHTIPHVRHVVRDTDCKVTGLAKYARGNMAAIDRKVQAAVNGNAPVEPSTPCKNE